MLPSDYTHPTKVKHRDMLLSKCQTLGTAKRVLTLGGPHLQDIVQCQKSDNNDNDYVSCERDPQAYKKQERMLRKLEKKGEIRAGSVRLEYGNVNNHFKHYHDVYYLDTCIQWCR